MPTYESNYLAHHGILGMKWGIRRYQNPDGSLTEEGRIRYGDQLSKYAKENGLYNKHGVATDPDAASKMQYQFNKAYKNDVAASARRQSNGLTAVGNTANASNQLLGQVRSVIKDNIKDGYTKTHVRVLGEDPSHYTNAELKQMIDRLDLERRYNNLTTETVITKSEEAIAAEKAEKAIKNLETGIGIAGGVVTTAAAIASIVAATQTMSNQK